MKLDKAAEAIAKSIMQCDRMRVISHNDADGITSAGLICNAPACGDTFSGDSAKSAG